MNIVTDKKIKFGTFNKVLTQANLIDAQPYKFPLPKAVRYLRLKEFEAVQLGNERFYINVALFDAKLSGLAQIRIIDKLAEREWVYEQQLLPYQLNAPNNIRHSDFEFSSKLMHIKFENRLAQGIIKLHFEAPAQINEDLPAVKGSFTANYSHVDPLVVSVPFGANRGMYAHKAPTHMEGSLNLDEETYVFDSKNSFFVVDDHKGYYPYRMKWNWVASTFYNAKRELVCLNLTQNQSIDAERFNENALWIAGKLHLLPAVEFSIPDDKDGTWHVVDAQHKGIVNIEFKPVYHRSIHVNLGPLGGSAYEGPMGWLVGSINIIEDRQIVIDSAFAFAEQQYIRC